MSRLWISELEVGQKVEMTVRVVRASVQRTRTGEPYLYLTLADRTSKIAAKRWKPSPYECEALPAIKYAQIVGEIQEYNEEQQLVLSSPLLDIGLPDDLSSFFACSPIVLPELQLRLHHHLASVRDARLKALLQSIFVADKKVAAEFAEYPAALDNHHVFRHGLLHHTLEVVDMVAALSDKQQYWGGQFVFRDLAVTGALLHDIGKAEEMREQDFTYEFSGAGSLLGHITLGTVYVARKIAKLRRNMAFPEELEHMLLHLISSHHGKGEWGSPKPPMTAEAILIHMADKLSVDLHLVQEARTQAIGDKAFVKQRKLDSGFVGTGRYVFVGDMNALRLLNDEPAVEEQTQAYPIPREFRLPVLRLVSIEEAEDSATFMRSLPLVGRIAAGQPILHTDSIEGHICVEASALGSGKGDYYLLRVCGDSMTGDDIADGDLIVVRHQEQAEFGDLVVALLEEGATVKRLIQGKGGVILMPSNPAHQPISVPDFSSLRIQGRVVGIARSTIC